MSSNALQKSNMLLQFPQVMFPGFPMNMGEMERFLDFPQGQSGLSVFEDEKAVYVEAALPGMDANNIDITFQNGMLSVQGNKKEEQEDKKRRYYRKANRSFFYQLAVPGNISDSQEPKAEFNNGILKLTFTKQKKETPKRIPIKTNNKSNMKAAA